MKKVLYKNPFELEILECEIPAISSTQVLLKIINAGICGSDLQIYHGKHKYMKYPVVGGHEASAIVESVGNDVLGFKAGDRVAVEPQLVCGECWPCRIGRFNVCEKLRVLGTHIDGLMAGYVAINPKLLHHCPDDMDFDKITLVEPMAVGVGAVRRAKYKGSNVAVIGAGTIGNLTAQAAQALGAKNVMVTDIMNQKLEYAQKCGVKNCINTKNKSLARAIDDTFGSRGADVIIDAVGIPASFEAALEASRPSSEIVITGNYKEPVQIELPRLQRREVNLIGHMMYVSQDYDEAIRLLYEGLVKVDGFITQRFALEELKSGFDFIDAHPNDVMKAVLSIGKL
jgi:L-iditol 2-dehydrogenase